MPQQPIYLVAVVIRKPVAAGYAFSELLLRDMVYEDTREPMIDKRFVGRPQSEWEWDYLMEEYAPGETYSYPESILDDKNPETMATNAYLITLNGEQAALFASIRAMLASKSNANISRVANILGMVSALYGSEDDDDKSLLGVFDELATQIAALHIPQIIPYGKSEADMAATENSTQLATPK